jgi:glycerol-3-phosphate dehydrogenase
VDIGVIGGGINGLCCAWLLAKRGHKVELYERDKLMNATSRSSSKLLHGGLRYLENGEFRLVRESLRERDAWMRRAPHLAKPLRLVLPIYSNSRRPSWMIALGFFLYDHLSGKTDLPKSRYVSSNELIQLDPTLNRDALLGGYEYYDGQMDDHALGSWVAEQALHEGVRFIENCEITNLTECGQITEISGARRRHDMLLNVAGPWAQCLLQKSDIESPYQLDLVRGSHIILDQQCTQAYLLEAPNDRRIFFVLPWQGQTLLGTTEVRQSLDERIECSSEEKAYLLNAWSHYFPNKETRVVGNFSGLRPLLRSAQDPTKATREYAITRTGNLVTVMGGKWTTAMAVAHKVLDYI